MRMEWSSTFAIQPLTDIVSWDFIISNMSFIFATLDESVSPAMMINTCDFFGNVLMCVSLEISKRELTYCQ